MSKTTLSSPDQHTRTSFSKALGNNIFRILFLAVGILFMSMSVGLQNVYATTPPLNPNDIPTVRKNDFTSYNNIANPAEKYALTNWVSVKDQPSNCCSITVPYGTTFIDFEVHGGVWLHKTLVEAENGATYSGLPRDGEPNDSADANYLTNRIRINGYGLTGQGSLSNTDVGTVLTTSYTNASRYWFPSSIPSFRYNTPALTANTNIQIRLDTTTINTFKGSQHYCGSGGASIPSVDYTRCAKIIQPFDITINVSNPPASNADVNGIKVTDAGNDSRDSAIDGEAVTLTCSDGTEVKSTNPFFFNGQPTSGTCTISVPSKAGWTVLGTAFCDQQITTDGCSSMVSSPTTYPGYNSAGNGAFRSGSSRVFGPLTKDHTYAFRIVYKKACTSSCAWELRPTTEVNTVSAKPGDTVYFDHLVTEIGGKDAPGSAWTYQILSSTNTGGSSNSSGEFVPANDFRAVGENFGYARTYTIPSTAADGSRICQNVRVTNAKEGTTNVATSPERCVTVTVNSPPPPAPGCAGLPNPSTAYVDVALPHQDVSDPAPNTLYPDGRRYSDNPYSSDIEQVPYSQGGTTTKETKVTAINDISGGGNRVPPTQVSEAYQTVKLDYTPYINAYSYDFNQPSVTYDSYYSQRTWTTDGTPDKYECRTAKPNMTGQGTPTCYYNYPAYDNYQCEPGSSGGGSSSTCTRYTSGTYNNHPYCSPGTLSGNTCTYSASGSSPNYTCPSGGSGGGTSSSCTYTAYSNWYYDCPAGWSGGGWSSTCYQNYTSTTNNRYCDSGTGDYVSGSTCYGSYQSTRMYEWIPGGWNNRLPRSNTVNGPQMSPCYDREFDLYPNATSAIMRQDAESPENVTLVSSVTGTLSATPNSTNQPNLRSPLRVNGIQVTGTYWILSAAGAPRDYTNFTFGSMDIITYSDGKTYNPNDSPGAYFFNVSRPPLQYGDRICFTATTPISDGTMKVNGDKAGSVSRTSAESPPTCTEYVANKPYFKVFNGDVSAGGNFENGGSCSAVGAGVGKIIGQYRMNQNPGNFQVGAGTQLAAFALAPIDGFASANLRTAAPTAPQGLTFANMNVPNNGFGGSFGNTRCVPDFYNTTQFNEGDPAKDVFASRPDFQVDSLPTKKQTLVTSPGSPVRIHAGTGTPYDKRHTLYINGDAYIDNDIIYANNSATRQTDLPYLTIIVQGNIYIDRLVNRVDGLYIAQPRTDGSGGNIYTCRNGANPIYVNMDSECNRKLTVNGAFIANSIYLQRTRGTLKEQTVPYETPASNNIAEVFIGTADSYLGRPVFKTKTGLYDSIKSLPPVY